jgi:hypothetical protein
LTLSELLRVAYASVVLWDKASFARFPTQANRWLEWATRHQ